MKSRPMLLALQAMTIEHIASNREIAFGFRTNGVLASNIRHENVFRDSSKVDVSFIDVSREIFVF